MDDSNHCSFTSLKYRGLTRASNIFNDFELSPLFFTGPLTQMGVVWARSGLNSKITYLSSSHQEEYRLPHWLNCLPVDEEFIVFPEMSELQVQTTHSKVEPSESGPNWLHRNETSFNMESRKCIPTT